ILVDRLWPRGVRRSTANIDSWLRDVAPSKELRNWFMHDPKKWPMFQKKYIKELEANEYVRVLINKSKREDITLVYTSSDKLHNNAIVLFRFLRKKIREEEKEQAKLMKEKEKRKALRSKTHNMKFGVAYS
ncbi:MAG: DUF488 domain-containing protein, partial [Candidatus Micrarchaeia archaeon]